MEEPEKVEVVGDERRRGKDDDKGGDERMRLEEIR